MRLLPKLFGVRDAAPVNRRGVHPGTAGWSSSVGLTSSGVNVTIANSLAHTAVWACVSLLSSEVAKLPLVLYQKLSEDNRKRATDHPLYRLLRYQPNRIMTAFDLLRLNMVHVTTWGNAYNRVEWRNGYPTALWPMRPDWMQVEVIGDRLKYTYQEPGKPVRVYRDEEIMHLREMSFDGVIGLSPLRIHMETVGVGLAAKQYAGSVYGNGAWPGGLLKYEGVLNPETREKLKASWEGQHRGADAYGRTAVLDKGWSYEAISIPPQESMFLDSQQWTVTEIARIYGVPPHLIQDLEHATFSNIEHQSLDFLYHTLHRWLRMWEQAIHRDLLTPAEQESYYAEFLTADAVSVDMSARYQAYNIGIQTGILSINEVRARENLNAVEGGDVHLVPLNLAPLGSDAAAGVDAQRSQADRETRSQGDTETGCTCGREHRAEFSREKRAEGDDPFAGLRSSRQQLAIAQRDLFEDAARRIVRRETADIRRALDKYLRKRSAQEFTAWLEQFYQELDPVIRDTFGPLIRSVAKVATREASIELAADDLGLTEAMLTFVAGYLEQMSRHWTESSMGQILAVLNEVLASGGGPEEIADAVSERLDQWEERRPGKVGENDPFEALNALLIAAYSGHEVRYLRWLASGDSCAFCLSLNGQVAGIDEYFVPAGTLIDAGPGLGSMRVRSSKRHGPLHHGCDCVVMAA